MLHDWALLIIALAMTAAWTRTAIVADRRKGQVEDLQRALRAARAYRATTRPGPGGRS